MAGRRASLLDKMELIAELAAEADDSGASDMSGDDEEGGLRAMQVFDEEDDEDSDDQEDVEGNNDGVVGMTQALAPLYEDDIDPADIEDDDGDDDDDDDDDESSTPDIAIYGYGDVDVGPQGSGRESFSSTSSPATNRRASFADLAHRRTSEASYSLSSAPARSDAAAGGGDVENPEAGPGGRRRRITIHAPSAEGESVQEGVMMPHRPSMKKRSQYRSHRSVRGVSTREAVTFGDSSTSVSTGSTKTPLIQSIRTNFAPRRSTRRSTHLPSSSSSQESSSMGMAAAVDRLGNQDTNQNWENVAAAAAVVAATTAAPSKRGHVQFSQDDHALVMLTLLNITNHDDDRDLFTVAPVNTYGYPAGEGKTDAEKQGPYSFVLCVVKNVHFDEDERYYTVRRADTHSEQRADPGWMEALRDVDGLEAAYRAAHRTARSQAEGSHLEAEKRRPIRCLRDAIVALFCWPSKFIRNNLIPCYQRTRAAAKEVVRHTLYGDAGYACKLNFTGVNLLVICSFVYLFIEVIDLAFLPPRFDYPVAVVGLTVWCILALELIFEYLIRPPNYHDLIASDKAFAPSTARMINAYHLVFEALSLLLFIPEFRCIVNRETCGARLSFSLVNASLSAVTSTNGFKGALGHAVLGLTFLRAFGLVRHWKQMWINHTFERSDAKSNFIKRLLLLEKEGRKPLQDFLRGRQRKVEDEYQLVREKEEPSEGGFKESSEEDQRLKNAATIGTALMVVNSHRALVIILFISVVFPALYSFGRQNTVSSGSTGLLRTNNILANSSDDCDYLEESVHAWLKGVTNVQTNYRLQDERENTGTFVVWAQLLPVRCAWQKNSGVVTLCPRALNGSEACETWSKTEDVDPADASVEFFADMLGLRLGGLVEESSHDWSQANFTYPNSGRNATEFCDPYPYSRILARNSSGRSAVTPFCLRVIFNHGNAVSHVNTSLFILLVGLLMLCLIGLTVMRGDAGRLVLDPLRRMLKIIVRYAENPLSQSVSKKKRVRKSSADASDERSSFGDNDSEGASDQLGHYETEQLISAIAKIADLLRKCWGIAGAGIISSNLARNEEGKTVVFNPTIPGKRVYALFGFVAINEFSKQLRVLDKDVMILINDVARVVHEEVFRWALGDSGQCNKNLGPAFLMVFRIGDFTEVHDKQKRATDVVFNSQMKGNVKVRRRKSASKKRGGKRGSGRMDMGNDTLQLASLPGIQAFTDRALLGFLKSFASIHRDRNLQNWKKDFRLGAGVGAFTVNVIYGMDAGWAVEGAVGSEYKIDATYLSPHVNMASRMMSAAKQYGVTILLSQAVEELLSRPAQAKLRHLDTVYVKGSSVAQRIFTYDARFEGVDFFLFERAPEQADIEAEAYTPGVWENDQDLRSMRQHVTDEFMEVFKRGVDQYIEGDWKSAIENLKNCDDMMIQAVLDEGYVETKDVSHEELFDRDSDDFEIIRLRERYGDGACRCLVDYMERRNAKPPEDWHGVRALMSK